MELVPGNTLITATPEEGRALAIKLARLTVKATQPDDAVREHLRSEYAEEHATGLISVAQVVALEFATIAAANGYWR
ncbi:hexameric tyrosine-coordinated heme protein [Streptomyces sp. NPDC005209]|uniref:hexameric tyrosine-coordinated heme protein n=1 Tax=Streptomyces sp. NPDC005209 TaxID=3156715 RepID=UPI0033B4A99F